MTAHVCLIFFYERYKWKTNGKKEYPSLLRRKIVSLRKSDRKMGQAWGLRETKENKVEGGGEGSQRS